MGRYLLSSVGASAGGLFFLDTGRGELRRLHRGRLRGLTWGPDGCLYAVTGLRQTQEMPSRILRFRPDDPRAVEWQAEDLGPVPWKGCHDLRWCPEQESFFLAASLGNYIVRLDPALREVGRMQLAASEDDVCHVNCLTENGGELYASVFTLSTGRRQEKRLTSAWTSEGKILRLDFSTRRFSVAHESLAQPHSLVWRDGRLYLLESHTSELTCVDLAHAGVERLARMTGFARGLAIGADEAVVGVSRKFSARRRHSSRVPLLTRLRESLAPFEGVLVLDPASWGVMRRIPYADLEPYDIVPLAWPDPQKTRQGLSTNQGFTQLRAQQSGGCPERRLSHAESPEFHEGGVRRDPTGRRSGCPGQEGPPEEDHRDGAFGELPPEAVPGRSGRLRGQ